MNYEKTQTVYIQTILHYILYVDNILFLKSERKCYKIIFIFFLMYTFYGPSSAYSNSLYIYSKRKYQF
jgi:hypothetical protein